MKLILSLGSNLGDKKKNLELALLLIEQRVGKLVRISKFAETAPEGFVSENQFLNAVAELQTKLSPYRVLKETQKIERLIGRRRKTKDGAFEDRLIDIDILLYGSYKVQTKRLTIPHPRMWEREFLRAPLEEVLLNVNKKIV